MAQRASQSAVSRTTRAGALLAMGAGLALGVATLAVALGGCASHPPPAQSDGPSMAPAMDELALLADRERRRPVDAARRAPPPPGLATDDFAPVDPADANARRTLAEAVAAFGAAPDADAGPQDAAPVDALRLYASGRAALLSGDLTVAERDLRAAVELDPWSPEARVALAEATLLRGNRIAASAEFAAALERDPMNLRALEFLGREAAQLGDDDRATRLLARAWRLPLAQRDAGLPFLVAADLGEALHRLGWLTAGNESLTVAARIPEPFPSASRHGRDLAALYRERPNFWRDIGDAALRLGDQRTALNAYREASAFPTFDDGSAILLRRVYAAMGAGSPAAAALAIVEDARRVGRFEERHVALTRHVASVQSVRRPLRRAIDEAAAAFTPDVARLNAGLTARTRAAASPDDQALATLRARLALAPADAAAMSDLFDRVGRDNPTGALRETIRLIEASPMNEPRFTRGLFAAQPNLSALGAAWRTVPSSEAGSGAGRLLRARLQATRDPVSAEESLTALLTERPGFTPARVARIETLVQLGRLDEADAELLRIDEGASPETRYAKALALQAMQRYRDALGMLQPLLPPATPLAQADPQHVLRAAELSVAVSEFQSAAAWYTRLAEIDPSREDAYAGLIHLYAANGPLANEAKLTQTLRALRESAPASRTIRRLAAREMAMVGQSDRAARELQDLIGEDPEDREALSLLVGVWLNAGRADLAEPWLRERLAAEPDDGPLVSELARTLAQSGRAQEAESLLRERLSAAPDDLEAARRLEMILRGPLQRASEADALAAARLARAPRTPDTAIELAEVLIRRGAIGEAADTIDGALGERVTLRPDQTERLAAAAIGAAEASLQDRSEAPATLRLIDAVRSRSATLPEPLHRARIVLLALTGEPGDALGAVRDASREMPASALDIHRLAIQALREAQRPSEALRVAEEAGLTLRPIAGPVALEWLNLAVTQADGESAERAVKTIVDDRVTRELFGANQRGVQPDDGALAANLAVEVGMLLTQAGADDGADALYRLALRYNPRNPMANNNLGYRMLERGEDLEEAERLIATAYEEDPTDLPTIDSLGWARYLRGVLEDVPNEGGEPTEGAVTLLRRAASMTDPDLDDATYVIVHDHLGDALWASGRADEAVQAWTRAQRVARRTVETLTAQGSPESEWTLGEREVAAILPSIARKIDAVAAGEEPPLAKPGAPPPAAAPPAGAS